MVLKVYKDSDPILREISQPVKAINKEIKQLVSDMMATMRVQKGIGLSAIQVGKPLCVLVFDIGSEFGILINPKIVAVGFTYKQKEGCLSLPGKKVEVDRYDQIKVVYYNIEGKRVEKAYAGLAAAVVQHEMDHFQGKLITDYEEK